MTTQAISISEPDVSAAQRETRRSDGELTIPNDRVLLLAGDSLSDLREQLGSADDDADLVARNDALCPPRDGALRMALVGATAKRLGLARKVVDSGRPWRGRNDIWLTTSDGLLAPDQGRLALMFPGVEPEFDPQVDDIADWLGLPPLDLGSVGFVGVQATAIVAVGLLLHQALLRLGVVPDVVVGHSIGELTAVAAAGLVPRDDFDRFIAGLDVHQVEVADTVFAALGCGVDAATAAIGDRSGVTVSHDNCPHQSVICGLEGPVREVLGELRRQKVVCQEFPFRSGFHSPMFEPYLPGVVELLDQLPIRRPDVEIWSATTCAPYPTDDAEIRHLAARHLVEEVRFRTLVENLHRAGVRGFVQVGVGSLVGFADDTLAGSPAICLEGARPRRQGLDQLMRVLAGLWSEGREGLRFDRLLGEESYRSSPVSGRETIQVVAPDPSAEPERLIARLPEQSRSPRNVATVRTSVALSPSPTRGHLQGGSVEGLFRQLMDDIASTSEQVVSAAGSFVGSSRARPIRRRGRIAAPRGHYVTQVMGVSNDGQGVTGAASAHRQESFDRQAPNDGETSDDGQSVHKGSWHVSVDDMPHLFDHCFVHQPEGWPNAADRFPVVPLTTLISKMADIALARYSVDRSPSQGSGTAVAHVSRISDIRALRWTSGAPPIEVDTSVRRVGPGAYKVVLEGFARATIEISEEISPSPAARGSLTGDLRTDPYSAELVYASRALFHGASYQCIVDLGPLSDRGITGLLESRSAPGSLLDGVGQLLGHWIYVVADHNQLALPAKVDSMDFYGEMLEPRSPVRVILEVRSVTEDDVVADVDLLDASGALWCRIEGWVDRRFATDDAVTGAFMFPEHTLLAEEQPEGWFLARERWNNAATRELVVRNHTTYREYGFYEGLNPARQRHWALGRVAGKDAVRRHLAYKGVHLAPWPSIPPELVPPGVRACGTEAGGIYPAQIEIVNDEAGAPQLLSDLAEVAGITVSLAHTDWLGVAIVGEGEKVGIDIERVVPRAPGLERLVMTDAERSLIDAEGPERDLEMTTMWCVKEAAAKAAGTGFQGRPRSFVVSERRGSRFVVEGLTVDTKVIEESEGAQYVVAWTVPQNKTSGR